MLYSKRFAHIEANLCINSRLIWNNSRRPRRPGSKPDTRASYIVSSGIWCGRIILSCGRGHQNRGTSRKILKTFFHFTSYVQPKTILWQCFRLDIWAGWNVACGRSPDINTGENFLDFLVRSGLNEKTISFRAGLIDALIGADPNINGQTVTVPFHGSLAW